MKIWFLDRKTGTISKKTVSTARYNFALTRISLTDIPEWLTDDPCVEDFTVWSESLPSGRGRVTAKDLRCPVENLFYAMAGLNIERDWDDTTRMQTESSKKIEKSYSDSLRRRNTTLSRSFSQSASCGKRARILLAQRQCEDEG